MLPTALEPIMGRVLASALPEAAWLKPNNLVLSNLICLVVDFIGFRFVFANLNYTSGGGVPPLLPIALEPIMGRILASTLPEATWLKPNSLVLSNLICLVVDFIAVTS